ncbi:MAG TPA: hydrolase 2, exosortase A system-associated [Steroidobacteraceae bacterium]|nr:hydrolase 2, exosortase A system-associated [Steroidobacteraceae bacterium]
MSGRVAQTQPRFFDGVAGRLFGIEFAPIGAAARATILIVPPFAEELNKSRRMLALAARALAALGYRVLTVDLYGTGDSEGDFADARWEIWIEDLRRLAATGASGTASPVSILALRAGSLLAADLIADGAGVERLALWQPVSSGAQFLTQFLRLKIAADMLGGNESGMAALREQLAAGKPQEVAGYMLAPELARALEGRTLSSEALRVPRRVAWFEIVARQEQALSVPGQRMTEKSRQDGASIASETLVGLPFWSTPEISTVPGLVASTARFFAEAAS